MGSTAAVRESAAIPQKPHREYTDFSSSDTGANQDHVRRRRGTGKTSSGIDHFSLDDISTCSP